MSQAEEASLQSQVYDDDQLEDENNVEIRLNIRGEMFTITRDELMALPESILLCLFPNGVFVDVNGNVLTNLTEDDIVYVNFSPQCFRYIRDSFRKAQNDLTSSADLRSYDMSDADILNEKPSIIVLREDLDYYVIPPTSTYSEESMKRLKRKVGDQLQQNLKIFEGLGYRPNKPLGPAEQHLLDMLCSSGFSHDSQWGNRYVEPDKTVLSSLALVRLRQPEPVSEPLTPTASHTDASTREPRSTSRSRLATLAQNAARSASRSVSRSRSRRTEPNSTGTKLLLFWRKPARKCWWSQETLTFSPQDLMLDEPTGVGIKVHARRVWTLELSVIGVQ